MENATHKTDEWAPRTSQKKWRITQEHRDPKNSSTVREIDVRVIVVY
jgi:hypothetical protein